MNIKIIQYDSDEYKQECELRHKVLRIPLGMNLYDEDLTKERDYLHIGLFVHDEIKACAIAIVKGFPQIKQVAVDEEDQGKGYGKIIMEAIEAELIKLGYKRWFVNSRKTALPFYEKLEYKCVGEDFFEVNIPHVKMEKSV